MPNSLLLQREDLNGPSFNPVPALVAKLLTVWVRTSEHRRTIVIRHLSNMLNFNQNTPTSLTKHPSNKFPLEHNMRMTIPPYPVEGPLHQPPRPPHHYPSWVSQCLSWCGWQLQALSSADPGIDTWQLLLWEKASLPIEKAAGKKKKKKKKRRSRNGAAIWGFSAL